MERGTKDCINSPGHTTKMAATLIYGINLQKHSAEPEVLLFETWHAASGAQAQQSLYKMMARG